MTDRYFRLTLLLNLTFFFLLAPLSVYSASKSPSIEEYGALPTVSKMAISPSGNKIAYRLLVNDQDLIKVFSLKEGKMITGAFIGKVIPSSIYFISDDQIIFTSYENKRVQGFKGEFDVSTAFVLDAVSGEIRQLLTPGDGIYKGQSGLGRIIGLSPDGNYAYMPAFVAKNKVDQSPNYSLVQTSLEAKRTPKVIRKGTRYTDDYFVNAKGEVIAEERYNERTNIHSIRVPKDGKWATIFSKEVEVQDLSVVGLTPDYQSLVVLTESPDTGRVAYYTLSLQNGSLSEPVFDRDDADIESVLVNINRIVYGVRFSGFSPSYAFFDAALDLRVKQIIAAFPNQSVHLTDWTPDWQKLIVRVEGSNYAGDYYLSSGDTLGFLVGSRATIPKEVINPVSEFRYKARDGLTIPALLTMPYAKIETLTILPTIVLPHGGPESYDRLGFDWLSQALASRGYLVLQPQFRGSRGFGLQHRLAGRGEWGKKMQDDLTDGIQKLIKEKLTDPERVCIVGASYGGYAALAGGAFTPELYRCVVSINGVSDLPLMMKQEKSDHGRNHQALSYWDRLITNGETDNALMEQISPINFAENFQAPVLLLHGNNDSVVSIDQSKRMHRRLTKANKKVTFHKLKGEDHYLSKSNTRKQALKAVIDFVDKQMGNTKAK